MTQAQHGTVVVLGSTNWDICMHLPRLPAPGDTVGGWPLAYRNWRQRREPGCSLVTLAEAPTQFISCIGDDTSAATIRQAFRTPETRRCTCSGYFELQAPAPHASLLMPKVKIALASLPVPMPHLSVAMVEQAQQLFAQAKVLLLQLETPLASVLRAAELAHIGGARVVLNPAPAPAQPLPDTLYKWIDVLTPNRGELAELAEVAHRYRSWVARRVRTIVNTRGEHYRGHAGRRRCAVGHCNRR